MKTLNSRQNHCGLLGSLIKVYYTLPRLPTNVVILFNQGCAASHQPGREVEPNVNDFVVLVFLKPRPANLP